MQYPKIKKNFVVADYSFCIYEFFNKFMQFRFVEYSSIDIL